MRATESAADQTIASIGTSSDRAHRSDSATGGHIPVAETPARVLRGALSALLTAHRRVATVTILAAVAMAVLVGHDGSPGWQLTRVGAVAAATATVVALMASAGDVGCGRLAAGVGMILGAVGAGFLPYVVEEVNSPQAMAGTVVLITGVVLITAGTVLSVRRRHTLGRIGTALGTVALAAVVTFVVGPAVAATNVPRPPIAATPATRGLVYEAMTVMTDDGVRLAGWYLPSTTGAAVVLLHGAGSTRSDVLAHAAVLARHGFGVLMIDARGHGDSAGRAMDFGWYGDADIAAATGYLARRPDVDRQRIGAVGLSMGGEEALGASASNPLIRAVVAEGATARNATDEAWLSDEFGWRGLAQEQLERLQDLATAALTTASVPISGRRAVEMSGETRYLLITAGDVADEGRSAEHVASAAPDRVQIWTVRGAGHTDGLDARPVEWETRVVDFLTEELGTRPVG